MIMMIVFICMMCIHFCMEEGTSWFRRGKRRCCIFGKDIYL